MSPDRVPRQRASSVPGHDGSMLNSSPKMMASSLQKSGSKLTELLSMPSLINLGRSPNLSTDPVSPSLLEAMKSSRHIGSSAKKRLHLKDLVSSGGASLTAAELGKMFLRKCFPMASNMFIADGVEHLMSEEGYELMMSRRPKDGGSQRKLSNP